MDTKIKIGDKIKRKGSDGSIIYTVLEVDGIMVRVDWYPFDDTGFWFDIDDVEVIK